MLKPVTEALGDFSTRQPVISRVLLRWVPRSAKHDMDYRIKVNFNFGGVMNSLLL